MGIFKKFKKNVLPNGNFVKEVNKKDLSEKSDSELKSILLGNVSDEVLVFATIKEIIKRTKGITLFDTQISAAKSMTDGKIIELLTGEGKTFAAVVAAIYFFTQGKSTHILVFNDYLANRDYTDNLPIFEFCSISLGCISENSPIEDRKKAYNAQVLYISAKEAGFDYLRSFLVTDTSDIVYKQHDIAIVDEADSIMIDEARVPLVLAGELPMVKDRAVEVSHAVSLLNNNDISIKQAESKVWLKDSGISKIEETLGIDNLYGEANTETLALVSEALKAHYLLTKDKEYIIKDGEIFVIDESTGRIASNRRFPDALHNAVEIKEELVASAQTMIYNSITIQSFLLRYSVLCGMTGTIKTSSKEIFNMYDLEVDVIPPSSPLIRVDHSDVVFYTNEEKERAVIEEILNAHKKGQPVLLGTASVEESQIYSKSLTKNGIPHNVLNAKNDEKEALIIAKAGGLNEVTVSTNMAGRGVDIKLGGVDESQRDLVENAGGLYVISTVINPSIRIDNQLRGRSGRRGDKGETKFFISLEDPLVCTYFKENDIDDDEVDEIVSTGAKESVAELIRKAQLLEEGRGAESRYMLERYSAIIDEQREVIEKYRTSILNYEKEVDSLQRIAPDTYANMLKIHNKSVLATAQRQLSLYFINLYWAQYLASMEDIRNGIHLMVVGGKSPIFEYNKMAIQAFDEMMQDIDNSIVDYMKICKITDKGVDLEAEGLKGASTTWTYMIDDSTSQFSRIPHIIKSITKKVRKMGI